MSQDFLQIAISFLLVFLLAIIAFYFSILPTKQITFEAYFQRPEAMQCAVPLSESNADFVQELIACAKYKFPALAAVGNDELAVIIQLREHRIHKVSFFKAHVASGNFFVIGDSAPKSIDENTRWKEKPVCEWFD